MKMNIIEAHIIQNGMLVNIPELPFQNKIGELYMDEHGAVELYIPETEEHTSFNLKLPRGFKITFNEKDIPKIYF